MIRSPPCWMSISSSAERPIVRLCLEKVLFECLCSNTAHLVDQPSPSDARGLTRSELSLQVKGQGLQKNVVADGFVSSWTSPFGKFLLRSRDVRDRPAEQDALDARVGKLEVAGSATAP